VKQAGRI